jgi:hypothetical protein
MMRLYYLRNACTSVQTIAAEVSHSVLSRYKSPMRAVACAALLCGTVTMPGALTWDAKPEVFSHVEASSAIRPVLGATMPIALPIEWTGQDSAGRASIAKSFSGFVSKANNSPLSAAAPFVSPEADSGSYAGRTEGSLRDTLARAGVPVEIREQIAGIFAARLDVAATAHEGDAYRVLYKRDDAAAQRKRVTAVELRSGGKVYQAVWFVAPGRTKGDYFSFDGQRLAAELFAMPLDYVRVSSPFGYRTIRSRASATYTPAWILPRRKGRRLSRPRRESCSSLASKTDTASTSCSVIRKATQRTMRTCRPLPAICESARR